MPDVAQVEPARLYRRTATENPGSWFVPTLIVAVTLVALLFAYRWFLAQERAVLALERLGAAQAVTNDRLALLASAAASRPRTTALELEVKAVSAELRGLRQVTESRWGLTSTGSLPYQYRDWRGDTQAVPVLEASLLRIAAALESSSHTGPSTPSTTKPATRRRR